MSACLSLYFSLSLLLSLSLSLSLSPYLFLSLSLTIYLFFRYSIFLDNILFPLIAFYFFKFISISVLSNSAFT